MNSRSWKIDKVSGKTYTSLLRRQAASLSLLVLLAIAGCTAPPPQPVQEQKPVQLPGFEVDLQKKEVRMEAEVCLDAGILEYLVCRQGTFEHEAIFKITAKPEMLHLALIMIGAKPLPFQALEKTWDKGVSAQGRLAVDVEWEEKGVTCRKPISTFILDRAQPKNKNLDAWVFTGSFFDNDEEGNRLYAANQGGVIIGIWPNPGAIIQYGHPTGNPYQSETQGMEINTKTSIPTETKVKLVFAVWKTGN